MVGSLGRRNGMAGQAAAARLKPAALRTLHAQIGQALREYDRQVALDPVSDSVTAALDAVFSNGDVRVAVDRALDQVDDSLTAVLPHLPGELPLGETVFQDVAALFRLAGLVGAYDLARYVWDTLGRMTDLMTQGPTDHYNDIPWHALRVPCPCCQGRTKVPAPQAGDNESEIPCPRCEGGETLGITSCY